MAIAPVENGSYQFVWLAFSNGKPAELVAVTDILTVAEINKAVADMRALAHNIERLVTCP
jgi:hypothetical protein